MLLLPITRPASVSRLHLSPPRPLPSAQRWHPMVGPGEDKHNPNASCRHLTFLTFFSLSLTVCASKVSREGKKKLQEYEISLRDQGRPGVLKSPPDYLTYTHTRPSTVPTPQERATFPSWVPRLLSLGARHCASFCTRPTSIPHPCPRPGPRVSRDES